MVTAVCRKWVIHSLDISSAFLQGDSLKRDVFLKPPGEVCPKTHLWKLKRCIYGLNDAPRSWYIKVKNELIELGGRICMYDPALFIWHHKNTLIGILGSHVDDFMFCGDARFHTDVIEGVKKKFKISAEASSSFKYVGILITQNENGIKINQSDYIQSMKEVEIRKNARNDEKLNKEELSQLRSISGQISWVASQTRPDISFECCKIANYGKNPDISYLKQANKTLRKLKNQNIDINIPNIGDMMKVEIICYTDATHASLSCGSSQGAFIIFLHGNGKVVPLSWQSKKLTRVTKSPLASETLALGDGADASFLIGSLIKEIFLLPNMPKIRCMTDNKSLFDTLKTTNVTKDMRLRVDIARLRQMEEKQEICVEWVEGKLQLADCLTKAGASSQALLEVLEDSSLSVVESH